MNPLMDKLLAPPERLKEVVQFLVELEDYVNELPNGGALARHIGWTAEAVWAYHFPGDDQSIRAIADSAYNAEG